MSKLRKALTSPSFRKKHGFTLIELLVVIAIIGILAIMVIVALNTARRKGYAAKVKEVVNTIAKAEEMYADDHNGSYTTVINDLNSYMNTTLPSPVNWGTGNYGVNITATNGYTVQGRDYAGNVIMTCTPTGCQ